MIFQETSIPGVLVIEPERLEDERGFFARTFCSEEFEARGLRFEFVQCSVSFNRVPGTLRGMHYQAAPAEEAKLVRCTRGTIYDVALDLRPDSETFRSWFAVELSAGNHRMLYIPEGVAHGFQTIEPDSEVFYQISPAYVPELARGVRWDDPAFSIEWPAAERTISESDRQRSDFRW
jgi:dTDP-4-dehydrorhamnose 3,5-epimerase